MSVCLFVYFFFKSSTPTCKKQHFLLNNSMELFSESKESSWFLAEPWKQKQVFFLRKQEAGCNGRGRNAAYVGKECQKKKGLKNEVEYEQTFEGNNNRVKNIL